MAIPDQDEARHVSDPIKALRDNGLLYIINDKILHTFGFALVLLPKESEGKPTDGEEFVGEFALMATEDREGFSYDEREHEEGKERYRQFLVSGGAERLRARKAAKK